MSADAPRGDVLEVCVPVATMWTSPDAPRDIDAAAVLPLPDIGAWTRALDAGARLGLHGRTLTQLLLGEPVEVLEEAGTWLRVRGVWQRSSRDPGGYPGWVHREHVDAPVMRQGGAGAVVMVPETPCARSDGTTVVLSFGTWLWLGSSDEESARVLLPGGGTGELSLRAVRLTHKRQRPAYDVEDVLRSAARFLGLPYLWGGTSAWGLDCSGLVHLAYRARGTLVPRDASDQATFVESVPVDHVRRGDLLFFAASGDEQRVTHVGFATGSSGPGQLTMLHAPEGGGIEDAPLDAERSATLVGAGRVPRPA